MKYLLIKYIKNSKEWKHQNIKVVRDNLEKNLEKSVITNEYAPYIL